MTQMSSQIKSPAKQNSPVGRSIDPFATEFEALQSSGANGSDSSLKALMEAMRSSASHEGKATSKATLMDDNRDRFAGLPEGFMKQQAELAKQAEARSKMSADVRNMANPPNSETLFDGTKIAEQRQIESLQSQLSGKQPNELGQLGDAIAAAKNGDPAAMANFTENGKPNPTLEQAKKEQKLSNMMTEGHGDLYDQPPVTEQQEAARYQEIVHQMSMMKAQAKQLGASKEVQNTLDESTVTAEVSSGVYLNIFLLGHIKPMLDTLALNPSDSSSWMAVGKRKQGPNAGMHQKKGSGLTEMVQNQFNRHDSAANGGA